VKGEIAVRVGGVVHYRFIPHGPIQADEVLTPRIPQYPPIPIGAELLLDGAVLGTVRCVRRELFSRWAIVFNPVDDTPQAVDGVGEGTPIAALEPHLEPRTFGTVVQLAGTVEALMAKTDEALRAIDGIGPKRLREIRAACEAALAAAG